MPVALGRSKGGVGVPVVPVPVALRRSKGGVGVRSKSNAPLTPCLPRALAVPAVADMPAVLAAAVAAPAAASPVSELRDPDRDAAPSDDTNRASRMPAVPAVPAASPVSRRDADRDAAPSDDMNSALRVPAAAASPVLRRDAVRDAAPSAKAKSAFRAHLALLLNLERAVLKVGSSSWSAAPASSLHRLVLVLSVCDVSLCASHARNLQGHVSAW